MTMVVCWSHWQAQSCSIGKVKFICLYIYLLCSICWVIIFSYVCRWLNHIIYIWEVYFTFVSILLQAGYRCYRQLFCDKHFVLKFVPILLQQAGLIQLRQTFCFATNILCWNLFQFCYSKQAGYMGLPSKAISLSSLANDFLCPATNQVS